MRNGQEKGDDRESKRPCVLNGSQNRNFGYQGLTGMVLHPLAQVGIGMFVSVVIGGSEIMVDGQGGGEGGQGQQQHD